jgi:hypothetical protein
MKSRLFALLMPFVLCSCLPHGPDEPFTREDWSALATQTEQVAEHIYQHNETDLDFVRRLAEGAFGPGFLTAKSWDEVSRVFPAAWGAGREDYVREHLRLAGAFEEHAALAGLAAIFESRAVADELFAHAGYGTGPDFDEMLEEQSYTIDRGGLETKGRANDRLRNAGPVSGWPVFSALDIYAFAAAEGRGIGEGTLVLARELAQRGAPLGRLAPLEALFAPAPFAADGFDPTFRENGTVQTNPLYEGLALADDPFAPGNIESVHVVAERLIRAADALAAGTLAEGMASMNLQFLALQSAVQNESRRFNTLSNASKHRHEAAMSSIRNMK